MNEFRPDNLPPNQGGKYTGFGSSGIREDRRDDQFDDPLATVSKGWGLLSSLATAGAKLALTGAETLGKTVTEKVSTC
jgi:ADP-ribosylation factor GTPase-activating protein 1